MITPSKHAKKYTLYLDSECPLNQMYYQDRTYFMHPDTFNRGYELPISLDYLQVLGKTPAIRKPRREG